MRQWLVGLDSEGDGKSAIDLGRGPDVDGIGDGDLLSLAKGLLRHFGPFTVDADMMLPLFKSTNKTLLCSKRLYNCVFR